MVLLVARQNGKSALLQILSLWRMYVDGAPLIIGTAQNLDQAKEQWEIIVEVAQGNEDLKKEIAHVDRTNGQETLRLTTGQRYKVKAASRSAGRGLSGDLVLLDELREHQKWDAWSAVSKTTMARDESQIWAASNAGDATSVVLAHLRAMAHLMLGDPDGINGEDVVLNAEEADGDIGIFEWSAAPDCDLFDREGWAQANPSMGWVKGMERKIAGFARTDPERVFRTEVLCQWVDSMQEGAFPPGVWEATQIGHGNFVSAPVVAVDMRPGMKQSVAVVVAGRSEDGTDLVKVARYEAGRGQQWSETHVADYVAHELDVRGQNTVVMDKYAENGPLLPLLVERGIDVTLLDVRDMRDGCIGFHDAVINGRLKHLGEEPLNVAVLGARSRKSGEAWIWSRSLSITDATPLMAAVAAWWVHASRESAEYDILSSVY